MTAPTNQTQNQVELGITLEQARATIWPFNDFKGQPMGVLVDASKLTLKDLGFAAERAYDDRVRRAAMALMLERLTVAANEPAPAAGYVRVVSGGRSFSVRRQLQFTFIQGAFLGLALGALVILGILAVNVPTGPLNPPLSQLLATPSGIAILILVATIAVTLYKFITGIDTNLDKRIANHRKGEEGEGAVIARLTQLLDGKWTIFCNVLLPGRNGGDLDTVLVGPNGVWVLETKYYAGEYRNVGEHWEYKKGNRWKLASTSPSRQATDNAVRLSNFLKADGINQWVTPVVVWANLESQPSVENPSTAVWTLDNLTEAMGQVETGKTIPETNRQKIADKLTQLCERQKQKAAQNQV